MSALLPRPPPGMDWRWTRLATALDQERNGPGICLLEALYGGLTLQLQYALSLENLQ